MQTVTSNQACQWLFHLIKQLFANSILHWTFGEAEMPRIVLEVSIITENVALLYGLIIKFIWVLLEDDMDEERFEFF